jgi:hypothetical protein
LGTASQPSKRRRAVPGHANRLAAMRQGSRAHAAYRRWYEAAGGWNGFFRAVPLVALARGVAPPPEGHPPSHGDDGVAAALATVGRAEGWLGRADALLILDLPATLGTAAALKLGRYGLRPVVIFLRWPEPGALLPGPEVLASLLHGRPRRGASGLVQSALLLEAERTSATPPGDLETRFDNRYTLGAIDLPSAAQLREQGIRGVVACWLASLSLADDLARYLSALEAQSMPLRRLPLGASQ